MFNIVTPRDHLAELEAQFADFMKEPGSPRLARNCALTAYHLHEWVWDAWLENDELRRQALGIGNRKRDFVAWIERKCVWFLFIKELANGTTHPKNLSFEARKVSLLPFARNLPNAGFEDSHWDGPMPFITDGTEVLLIDFGPEAGEHRWMLAGQLLNVVVRFWREFFNIFAPPVPPESPPIAAAAS
jgi:hypothetical protein